MIELTPEQHAALERGDTLVRDAATNERFVLVRADVYDRLQSLLADDAAGLVNEVMADDDANDPLLESYQHFAKEAP